MQAGWLTQCLETADEAWGILSDTELALEANPDDQDHFQNLASLGLQRLSLGVQALEDEALKTLGRTHTVTTARQGIEKALNVFPRVSLDMMYGRPGQSLSAWERELKEVFTLGAEHLSLYALTRETGTALDRAIQRGRVLLPDEHLSENFYDLTQNLCEEAGYISYEVSNHARTSEAYSRHNLVYWQSGDWLGLGPGAHGRLTLEGVRYAFETVKTPETYCDHLRDHRSGLAVFEALTPKDRANERLLMGLRLTQKGVDRARLEEEAGHPLDGESLSVVCEEGLLSTTSGRLCVTPRGRALTDGIAHALAYT